MTIKERLYQLFSEGKTGSSPEVMALRMKGNTRRAYYCMWQREGKPSHAPGTRVVVTEEGEGKPKAAVKAKTILPGGESIKAISEVAQAKSMEESEQLTQEETALTGEKVKVKREDGKKGFPGSIVGEGLTATVTISVKTLALYQIAANIMQGDELSLGDFIDACVEDTFRVRGKDLGLITLGGAQS